jgi:hypothetical protein
VPKPKESKPGVKRVNLNIEVDLHNRFKAATAAAGTTMTLAILEFINQYVEENGVTAVSNKKKGRR